MATKIEALTAALAGVLGHAPQSVTVALGEVTVVIAHDRLHESLLALRDRPESRFEILADLCGVDYSTAGNYTSTLATASPAER